MSSEKQITNVEEIRDMVLGLEKEKEPDKEVQFFFNSIKSKINTFDLKGLEESLKEIPGQIERAERAGQIFLARKLKKHIYLMMQEKLLLEVGINRYVSLYEITKFISQIEDFVVKFSELEAFPRIIPENVLEKLEEVKKLDIFDEYWICFTDYTDEEIINEKAKQQRTINKDPIIFGTMKGYKDRYYFIVDWEDQYCDITFDKMVNTLKEIDPEYKPKEIVRDTESYINTLLPQIKEEIEQEAEQERQNRLQHPFVSIKPESKFKKFIRKLFNV